MDEKQDKLKAFLWERKTHLLNAERLAKGKAKNAITIQLQDVDLLFRYLSSQQEESDMEKLKLSLDDQLIPLDELKPRARENKIAEAIIEFVKQIPPGQAKPINQPGVSKRTVLSQVYALKEKGLLPPEIMGISRDGGKQAYIGRAKSAEEAAQQEKEVGNHKAKGR